MNSTRHAILVNLGDLKKVKEVILTKTDEGSEIEILSENSDDEVTAPMIGEQSLDSWIPFSTDGYKEFTESTFVADLRAQRYDHVWFNDFDFEDGATDLYLVYSRNQITGEAEEYHRAIFGLEGERN